MPRKKGSKSAKNQITTKPRAPNEPAPQDEGPKLTPYQGSFRAFGMFKCQKCNKYWTSSASWANFGQMCNRCHIIVYPFRQLPLEHEAKDKLDKSDPTKRHPQELCEKCRALGKFCATKDATQPRRRNRKSRRRRRALSPEINN